MGDSQWKTGTRSTVLFICLVAVMVAIGGGCNPGAAGMVLMPALFDPCDYDGTLSIELVEVGRPNWGGTTVWRHRKVYSSYRGTTVPGATVEVAFADDEPETNMKPAGTTLEVYRGTERLRVPSRRRSVGHVDGSCGYRQVEFFDLSGLAPGTYSLVHRRSSGISGQVFCGTAVCPWGTFDGEEALVTTLVMPSPEELPQLPPEEIASRIGSRLEGLRACCQARIANAQQAPRNEDVVVDIRIVEDGAYAIAAAPANIAASKPVDYCIRSFVNSISFEARPAEPMVARCRVVVSTDAPGWDAVHVEATLAEVFAEARDEAPAVQSPDP